MKRLMLMLCAIVAMTSQPLSAVDGAAEAHTPLRGSDCGQFLQAMEVAATRSPVSETAARAVQAALDEIVLTLFWAHGYLSGKSGEVLELSQERSAMILKDLTDVCKASGSSVLPISEAVKKL